MDFVRRDDEVRQGAMSRIFASAGDETRVVRAMQFQYPTNYAAHS